MRHRPVPLLLVIALTAISPRDSHATPVLLEDFEVPNTAFSITVSAGQPLATATNTWSVTANSIDLFEASALSEVAAFDGSQAVDLSGSGAGVMEVTFATTMSATYELVFHYARNNFLANPGDAQVDVIGSSSLLQELVRHDSSTHAFNEYLQFRGTFAADSNQAVLRFTSLNPGAAGITLDGISVSLVPEPGTAGLLFVGLLLLASARHRR